MSYLRRLIMLSNWKACFCLKHTKNTTGYNGWSQRPKKEEEEKGFRFTSSRCYPPAIITFLLFIFSLYISSSSFIAPPASPLPFDTVLFFPLLRYCRPFCFPSILLFFFFSSFPLSLFVHSCPFLVRFCSSFIPSCFLSCVLVSIPIC